MVPHNWVIGCYRVSIEQRRATSEKNGPAFRQVRLSHSRGLITVEALVLVVLDSRAGRALHASLVQVAHRGGVVSARVLDLVRAVGGVSARRRRDDVVRVVDEVF